MNRYSIPDRLRWSTVVLAAVGALLAAAQPAQAQEPLSVARSLYASARYDEALDVLDRLRLDVVGARTDELTLEKYRALCLLALGREDEAESAFAGVVAVDPTYFPDSREVSPSVQTFFRDVRRQVLPGIARSRYLDAKAAYEQGSFAEAADGFSEVLGLLEDRDMGSDQEDLRLLAEGFAELSRAKASAEASEMPPAPAEPPPAPAPAFYTAESPGVTPPVTLRQDLPPLPADLFQVGRSKGLLQILIDEQGRVASVVVLSSIHAMYDPRLIEAAMHWRYEPARINDQPVKYRKVLQVKVQR